MNDFEASRRWLRLHSMPHPRVRAQRWGGCVSASLVLFACGGAAELDLGSDQNALSGSPSAGTVAPESMAPESVVVEPVMRETCEDNPLLVGCPSIPGSAAPPLSATQAPGPYVYCVQVPAAGTSGVPTGAAETQPAPVAANDTPQPGGVPANHDPEPLAPPPTEDDAPANDPASLTPAPSTEASHDAPSGTAAASTESAPSTGGPVPVPSGVVFICAPAGVALPGTPPPSGGTTSAPSGGAQAEPAPTGGSSSSPEPDPE